MTNYTRGIIKHVEDLTQANERIAAEKKALKRENRELRETITRLEITLEERIARAIEKAIAPLCEQITCLEAENAQKETEIARLKAQINKDSSNSSKPPGTDGFKRVVNSREKSKNKAGGQPGHKGSTLTIPKNLDELVKAGKAKKHVIDLTGGSEKYISQWKIDLETVVVYTEYRCPENATASVFYGESIKAVSVLLSNEGMIAHGRLSDFIRDISGGLLSVSEASIEKFNREAAANVDIEALREDLLNGEVLNIDETTLRSTQIMEYGEEKPQTAQGTTFKATIRTHSNAETTLYTVNPHKDNEGVVRDGIIPSFVGILSHDHDKKYYQYGVFHATCGAHLSRELKGLYELYKIEWAERFRKFYVGLNDYKNNTELCEAEKLKEFEHTYDELLQEGASALSAMGSTDFGYKEFKPVLKRLREYKDAYLLFIRNYKAPFTNNQAERDLRPCKTKQKVSGCFRSWEGIVCYAKIRSFFSTARKRKVDLLNAVKGLLSDIFICSAEQ